MLYPVAWYCYFWIYKDVAENQSDIIRFFVWILGGVYSFIILIEIIPICREISHWNIIDKVDASIFVYSLRRDVAKLIPEAKELLGRLDTVGIVLESECLDTNSALIVLSYLGDFGTAPVIL